MDDIIGGHLGRDFLDIARRQRLAETAGQPQAVEFAVALDQQRAQIIMPVAHDPDDRPLQRGNIGLDVLADPRPDDQVQLRQQRLTDGNGGLQPLAVKGFV